MREIRDVTLGEIIRGKLSNGLSPSARGRTTGRVLTLSAVTTSVFRPEESKAALFDREPRNDQYAVEGRFLICRGNGNRSLVGAGVVVPSGFHHLVIPDTVISGMPDPRQVDPSYLQRVWSSPAVRRQVEAIARTTNGTHKVNQAGLSSIALRLPPLAEQKRIAAILDAADALRAKRRQSLALLDTLLQSTFLDMFGDPVTNPMGWTEATLGRLAQGSFRNGLSPSNKGLVDGEVLTLSAITRGRFDFAERKEGRFDRPPSAPQMLSLDTFLICRGNGNRGLVGGGAFPDRDSDQVCFPDTMIGLTVDRDLVAPAYLNSVWKSRRVRRQIEQGARTTNGTYKVNQSLLSSVAFPLPPIARQRHFGTIVQAIERQSVRQRHHLAELTTLFACLQSRAFRGEH